MQRNETKSVDVLSESASKESCSAEQLSFAWWSFARFRYVWLVGTAVVSGYGMWGTTDRIRRIRRRNQNFHWVTLPPILKSSITLLHALCTSHLV
jgi:hypothetical protein